MTDALFVCACVALACCGPLAMRSMWSTHAQKYGRILRAQELLERGHDPETTMREASRIERARKRGKIVVRTHRKVYTRAAK